MVVYVDGKPIFVHNPSIELAPNVEQQHPKKRLTRKSPELISAMPSSLPKPNQIYPIALHQQVPTNHEQSTNNAYVINSSTQSSSSPLFTTAATSLNASSEPSNQLSLLDADMSFLTSSQDQLSSHPITIDLSLDDDEDDSDRSYGQQDSNNKDYFKLVSMFKQKNEKLYNPLF